jgi:4-amino-4-deoxy-L-arabinose transferase-like glycosyltransferase
VGHAAENRRTCQTHGRDSAGPARYATAGESAADDVMAVSQLSRFSNRASLWLFMMALVLRAGWVGLQSQRSGSAFEFDDEGLHWALASNLVHTGQMVTDDGRFAARMPLYPLFLAIFAGAGESGILIARLVQALLGAATVWLVYRVARDALGERPALLAGALACVDPYAIFFTGLLLSEVLFTLIAVALTAAAWHLLWAPPLACDSTGRRPAPPQQPVRHHTCQTALALAVLGAAAVFTRPSALGWIVLLWLLLWFYDRSKRRATFCLLGYAVVLCAFMLPWGLRNLHAIGSFAWLSTNGGVTLYDAQGPQADGSSNQGFLARMPELGGLGEAQRDRLLRSRAIEQMTRDPWHVLKLAGAKFLRTWNFVPNFEGYRGGLTAAASAAFTALVLVLAGAGVWRTAFGRQPRPPGRFQVLVWLPVIYFTLLHCIFIGSLRYRVPLMPFLELSAAAAVFAPGRPKHGEA